MFQPVPYHHVAIGTGARQVHVAGQIARDAEANPVAPGKLTGQVAQVLRNTAPLPPVSLIGVDYLFEPDVLVEVEAFAVLG